MSFKICNHITNCLVGNQIKQNVMGESCGTHGKEENCL